MTSNRRLPHRQSVVALINGPGVGWGMNSSIRIGVRGASMLSVLRVTCRIAAVVCFGVASAAIASIGGAHAATPADAGAIRLAQVQPKTKQAQPAAAPAAPAAAPGEPTAWAVTCSNQTQNKLVCEMTQNIVEQKSGGQIALISIKGTADGNATAMLLRLFHGVFLPAGISVRIDGAAPVPLQFQKSDRLGVYAALPLTDKLLGDLKKGKELKLVAQINQGEEMQISGSLVGFGPAFDKVNSIK